MDSDVDSVGMTSSVNHCQNDCFLREDWFLDEEHQAEY